jgi:hypothetical protein
VPEPVLHGRAEPGVVEHPGERAQRQVEVVGMDKVEGVLPDELFGAVAERPLDGGALVEYGAVHL